MKSRGISWKDVFLASVATGPGPSFFGDPVHAEGGSREPTEAEVASRRQAAAREHVAWCRAVADAAQETFDRDREEEEAARGGGQAPHRSSPQDLTRVPGFR